MHRDKADKSFSNTTQRSWQSSYACSHLH